MLGAENLLSIIAFTLVIAQSPVRYISYLRHLTATYTIVEVMALQLGSRSVLKTQFRVINHADEKLAMDFKRGAQDESQIVSIAVS